MAGGGPVFDVVKLKNDNFTLLSFTYQIYSSSERSEQFLVRECFSNLFLEVSQI